MLISDIDKKIVESSAPKIKINARRFFGIETVNYPQN